MSEQGSGYDALINALKKSGYQFDDQFGQGSSGGSQQPSGGGRGGRDGGKGDKNDKGSTPYVDVDMSLSERVGSWGRKPFIIAAIVIVAIGAFCYWLLHPPLNIHSGETWIFIGIFVLLPLFLVFASKAFVYKQGTKTVAKNEKKAKTYKWLAVIPVACVAVALIGGLVSLPVWPGNAVKYASILETTTYDFDEDLEEVDYSEIPVIDQESAELLGNREMGTIAEYVSQFEISSLYSQINYQGNPVRVSPLIYADLFKWFTNHEDGIPAYALVNMTTQEAEIVVLDEDDAIFYSESEPLARNIDRYVQLKYPFYMFDEKSFEIDDDGHAWWICPVQSRTIGLFGGTTITRVVLVDATTGECYDYAIEDVPQWVDHAWPTDLVIEQYNWYGKYSDGWLNSWLGQSGVVQTTSSTDGTLGYNYIAQDDDVWVYTGVTSATSDSSIVGFVLINLRTAESHFYSVAGATEDSAMESAEGQVQNLRYEATFPLLINVAGQPTYFMALKDDAGLVKMYAMIDIESYQYVAVGDTVEETQEAYLELLEENGIDVDGSDLVEVLGTGGVISSIAQAVIDGNSHFYVTLEDDDAIYDFELPDLLEILTYDVGDEIEFVYTEDEDANPVKAFGTLEEWEAAKAAEEAEEEEEDEDEAEDSDAEEEADSEDAEEEADTADDESGDDESGGDEETAEEESSSETVDADSEDVVV